MRYFKREVKRYKQRLSVFFEPAGIIILALLVAIPVIAVQNLNIQMPTEQRTQNPAQSNVLGADDKNTLYANSIEGTHNIVKDLGIEDDGSGLIKYSATVEKFAKGSYSKPILDLVNPTTLPYQVLISGKTQKSNRANFGIVVEDNKYIVQDYKGDRQIYKILVPGKTSQKIYLSIDSDFSTNSTNQFDLTLSVLE